ncbi:MAG: hypothetical protein HPY64_04105 [Anaerolineae bacterium]|nr:hypothetical protein [Anaerolineae bacterium]
MVQLGYFLWAMVALFAVIGFIRGSTREMIAMAGIVLGLFVLEQLGDVILTPLIGSAPLAQQFYVYAGILTVITLFAYETPARFERGERAERSGHDAREGLQEGLLGATIGGVNAYLFFGSLWYYMDVLHYPLSPSIMAPPLNSASAQFVNQLPLVFLLEGNLLTLLVIVLFLFVVVVLV